jgi:hypothetical protein
MPQQSEGGCYMSLNEGTNVYNSTTEPTKSHSVLESVKNAIGHAIGIEPHEVLLSHEKKLKIQPIKNLR